MPKLLRRKKYPGPKIRSFEKRKRSVSRVSTTYEHFDPETGFSIFERELSIKQIELMMHFKNLGLNVEEPFLDNKGNLIVIGKDKNYRRILTKNKGKTLDLLFPDLVKPNRKVALEIISQLAELLARIHEEGYCFYHPKPANVVWDGRKVGLIDFKVTSIFQSVRAETELNMFLYTVRSVGLSPQNSEVQKALKRLDEAKPKK
ncbi:MAG: hypothetical protein Q7K42_00975 [Candidatus Diapherotrites archaeon]|nr:hypothetical protein [Candidatus Diapherotrites archaeon]